ncbi:hypothetical protein ACFXPW_25510 [Streptomyces goshikiensis]|uniref:hypothetical protein n=1 Tax=Streptomyces goshikiensis TaxID=1942 RepID=UPI00369A2717
MKKRTSKPQRFAAVENDSIDSLSSLLAVGLLTRLIRARDGEDVTVETLCTEYAEGETSLTKAMRLLVEGAYVVKFKVQRAFSETQLDDDGQPALDDKGKPIVKRGGSWYTTFQVDAHGKPFSAEDVAEELDAILASGNVRAYRIEPQHLDPRKAGATNPSPAPARPTPKNRGVGQDASPQVGPTPGFPGVGQEGAGRPTPHPPGVGQGGALIRKKTVLKDSLSPSVADAPADAVGMKTRETAAPEGNPAPADAEIPAPRDGQAEDERGSELLEMLLGLPGRMHRDDAADLLPLAAEALAAGWTASRLRDHLSRRCDPDRVFNVAAIYRMQLKKLPSAPAGAGAHPAAAAPACSKCNGSGLAEDPETFLPIGPCECRKAPALAVAS